MGVLCGGIADRSLRARRERRQDAHIFDLFTYRRSRRGPPSAIDVHTSFERWRSFFKRDRLGDVERPNVSRDRVRADAFGGERHVGSPGCHQLRRGTSCRHSSSTRRSRCVGICRAVSSCVLVRHRIVVGSPSTSSISHDDVGVLKVDSVRTESVARRERVDVCMCDDVKGCEYRYSGGALVLRRV